MNRTPFTTAVCATLIAAGATLAPSAASAAPAQLGVAAEFDRFDVDRFDGLDDPSTKPCESTLFVPSFCFADYAGGGDSTWSYPTVRNGQPASFFNLWVTNENVVNDGALFTTVGIDEGDIIEVEWVLGDYDVDAFPIPEVGGNSTWVIEHSDGLDADEFTWFRVWVDGHGAFDVGATTNHHVGVEYFGYERPADYPQAEQNYSNNNDFDFLGFD